MKDEKAAGYCQYLKSPPVSARQPRWPPCAQPCKTVDTFNTSFPRCVHFIRNVIIQICLDIMDLFLFTIILLTLFVPN